MRSRLCGTAQKEYSADVEMLRILFCNLPAPTRVGSLVTLLLLAGLFSAAFADKPIEAKPTQAEITSAKEAADYVIADRDGVRASKRSGKVFNAARLLEKNGDLDQAAGYYLKGLQISPWKLEEQLAYAELLAGQGQVNSPGEIARMVETRTESDNLCNRARKILGMERIAPPPVLVEGEIDRSPWICLVRIGTVNNVALSATMKKLQDTLGIPVRLMETQIETGKHHRSAFDRWVRNQIRPNMRWETPLLQAFMKSRNYANPEDIPAAEVVDLLKGALKLERRQEELERLEEEAAFFGAHDQQWDAERMIDPAEDAATGIRNMDKAVIIGITEADLYLNTANYVFGSAFTGYRCGVVSYARFRADLFGEPPDIQRLTTRMHKQLLSTIGYALGVPRPTDPTSARAFPASLAEHDAKSEYMSEACIEGFERALGLKLPAKAHAPQTESRP